MFGLRGCRCGGLQGGDLLVPVPELLRIVVGCSRGTVPVSFLRGSGFGVRGSGSLMVRSRPFLQQLCGFGGANSSSVVAGLAASI